MSRHFRCQECGRCCRILTVGTKITPTDVRRLARHDGMTLREFHKTVTKCEDSYLMAQPCRYLPGDRCRVHDIKPEICVNYPFQYKAAESRESRWLIVIACPGGKELIQKLLSGRQSGLEYVKY